MPADLVVSAARRLVGTRFVPHGRDEKGGLDCVGLIALACDRAADAPLGYALRNSNTDCWLAILDGLATRQKRDAKSGDIMMFQVGPAQIHLGIWTGNSLIHADARLRRVVETPGDPVWPTLGIWQPD